MVAGSLLSREDQQKVLTLFEEGYSLKEILKRVEISRRSIKRIIDRGYVKHKSEYKKPTGRPRKISSRKEKQIKSIVKKNNRITRKKIIEKIGENVSLATISRVLKKLGL